MSIDTYGEERFSRAKTLLDILPLIPPQVFGASLALLGVALLPLPEYSGWQLINSIFMWLGFFTFSLSLILHSLKLLFFPSLSITDFKNPALMPFSAQVCVALFLLVEIAHVHHLKISVYLFAFSALICLVQFIVWSVRFVLPVKTMSLVTPAWMIPSIALLYLSTLGISFGFADSVYVIAAFGSIGIIASFGLICVRLFNRTLPSKAHPGLAIFVAAPALWLMIGLQLFQGDHVFLDIFYFSNIILFFISVGFFLLKIKNNFSIAYWAFGMPLCASVIAQSLYLNQFFGEKLMWFVYINSGVCIGIVLVISFLSLKSIAEIYLKSFLNFNIKK